MQSLFALVAAFVATLALAFTIAAVTASPAAAQLPAICDQYPDLPQCHQDDGGEDEDGNPGGRDDAEEATGPTGDTGGNLPFTGYPLTPLLLLLLALILAGATLRGYLTMRERLDRRPRS